MIIAIVIAIVIIIIIVGSSNIMLINNMIIYPQLHLLPKLDLWVDLYLRDKLANKYNPINLSDIYIETRSLKVPLKNS